MPWDLAVLGGASRPPSPWYGSFSSENPPWPLPLPLPCLATRPRRFCDFAKAFLFDLTDHPRIAATQRQPRITPMMTPTVAMVWEFWDSRLSMFLGRMGKAWVGLGLEWMDVALVLLRLVQGRQWRMILDDMVMLKQGEEVMLAAFEGGPE